MALDADGRIAYAQTAALISTGARARELDQMPAIVDAASAMQRHFR
ncbi:hypothetical protein [Frankia tisae]|nr:hypothetical protein [Frankia tisae]